MAPCAGIEVAHFPVRSLAQLERKVTLGWVAIIASGRDPEAHGIAHHWKDMYERVRANGALTWDDLRRFVAAYVPPDRREAPLVEHPMADHSGPIRHAQLQRPRTLAASLLEMAEPLARDRPPK